VLACKKKQEESKFNSIQGSWKADYICLSHTMHLFLLNTGNPTTPVIPERRKGVLIGTNDQKI